MLSRFLRSELGKDTTHLSIGQGLKLLIQAGYFVLIARSLGPRSYGAFAAVVALASLLSPFSGLGSANLFVKHVRSHRRTAALCWGNGTVATILTGIFFTAALILIAYWMRLRASLWIVGMVCLSDLILLRITELAAAGFIAIGQMKDNAAQSVIISLLRLIAIALLAMKARVVTLESWTIAYLATSVLGTLYCARRATQLWGGPRFNLQAMREDAFEGVYFSISTSAATIYNDIDKIMLGKYSFVAVGIYAAAYRIVDVAMTPIRSLGSAAYPRFFQKGLGGMKQTYSYALSLMRRSCIYGLLILIGLWIAAPVLPRLLGPHFANTVSALRWLALIPLLRCMHVFLADSLTGAGFQRTRTTVQLIVAAVNIGLNLALLPVYGWLGAAWTSLASDGLLVASLWVCVLFKISRASRLYSSVAAP